MPWEVFSDLFPGKRLEVKVENGVESATIVTNVQTFRDCALHHWNVR